MIALWTGLALAAVPAHVDLQDLDRWEAGPDQVLDGPSGCWEMVGLATWNWDFGRFGGSRGDALFVGRLDDGVWQEFHLEPLGEVIRDRGRQGTESRVYQLDEPRFAPLVGKITGRRVTLAGSEGAAEEPDSDEEENRSPNNLVRRALDDLGGSVDTAWAQWDADRQGVVLLRSIPMNESSRPPIAELTAFFPGGRDVAVSVDVAFPERFYKGRFPRWRLDDAVVHVRGRPSGDSVFPTAESFSFTFGVFGFSFTGAQTIRYKSAKRCEVPPPSEPEPLDPVPVAPETDEALSMPAVSSEVEG
jgi:hypothetical protein